MNPRSETLTPESLLKSEQEWWKEKGHRPRYLRAGENLMKVAKEIVGTRLGGESALVIDAVLVPHIKDPNTWWLE